jgi:phosphohistidine swiveling domain-containing protein
LHSGKHLSELTFFQNLNQVENPTENRIGGKAASLFKLYRLGLNTPPAWVVLTEVFVNHLKSLHLDTQIDFFNVTPGERGLYYREKNIHQLIQTSSLPAQMEDEIRTLFQDSLPLPIIVRSSATVEDSLHHSFAGVFESIPCQSVAEISTAIRQVWASVFTARALSYYQIAGLDRFPDMALIIQPLIEAERSGVLFSKFDRPGQQPGLLIEYTQGLGQKLVSGQVNPDRLWLDRWPETLDAIQIPTGDLARRTTFELAQVANILEQEFGHPQDIEWCDLGDELFILQTRPITTSPTHSDSISGLEVLLEGVGAGPGVGAGAVHLVFNINDADSMEAGQVLTTPMTNPDMVPSMQRSAAIVTDVGGMICHAAIVSRELGIPCVVGTRTGTKVLREGSRVTVDGTSGGIFSGIIVPTQESGTARELQWKDLWHAWLAALAKGTLPVVSTLSGISQIPSEVRRCVLDPFCDLTLNPKLEITPLHDLDESLHYSIIRSYILNLRDVLDSTSLERIYLDLQRLDPAIQRSIEKIINGDGSLVPLREFSVDPPWVIQSASDSTQIAILEKYSPEFTDNPPPNASLAVPLGFGLLVGRDLSSTPDTFDPGMEGMFGMLPETRIAPMPPVTCREAMHRLVPVLSEVHGRQVPQSDQEYPWLDLRPEVIITPFLKALVTPGVEIIPFEMGFNDPPLHIQFIRCRFHFRQDTLMMFFPKLIRSTWDENFLSKMLKHCRESYILLEARSMSLPREEPDLKDSSVESLRDGFVAWWNAFTEFFSLSFFIQAQGDDCIFPELGTMVDRNIAMIGGQPHNWHMPGLTELSIPVTPVLTAEYMQDLMNLHLALESLQIKTPEVALQMIEGQTDPGLFETFERVRARWYWMRERDIYYEPYDDSRAILDKALSLRGISSPDYEVNKARQELALALHFDLARQLGTEEKLVYAVKYGRALTIDRENHHIVWLRTSYRLRKLLMEWERRLAQSNRMAPRFIFFMQPWEILDALAAIPEPIHEDLHTQIESRREVFERENQLKVENKTENIAFREPDYY